MISKIDNSTLIDDFKEHLSDKKNSRILFSGPFGTGKTTFIDEFTDQYKSDYVFLKIAPVNYSVSSNDDIFDLIKFDLIIELLDNYGAEIDLSAEEFPALLTMQMFVREHFNLISTLTLLSSFVAGLDKNNPQVEAFETFSAIGSKLNKSTTSVFEAYKKFKKGAEDNHELVKIEKFIKKQENIAGLNESDNITGLIKDLILRAKDAKSTGNHSNKIESVMIIDDLDRLDPEHIFRLFNVFSAHYDTKNQTNKFGFDKVIFICDLNNIRNIFHHRYGQNVDFTGYIDKFYSKTPFDFDNRRYLKDQVKIIISKIPLKTNYRHVGVDINSNYALFTLLEFALSSLVLNRMINLRMVINYTRIDISNLTFRYGQYGQENIDAYNILSMFYVLKGLFIDWGQLEIVLEKLSKSYNRDSVVRLYPHYAVDPKRLVEVLINECLHFIVSETANKELLQSATIMSFEEFGISFRYNYNNGRGFATSIGNSAGQEGTDLVNPFLVILSAFRNIRQKGILN